ncbi:unnamed protein product [Parajaminaea phylloscopi]
MSHPYTAFGPAKVLPPSTTSAGTSASPASSAAATKPRRVLLPAIPRRKASHPDSRSNNASNLNSLSMSLAQAAHARNDAQGTLSPQPNSRLSPGGASTSTESQASTPKAAEFQNQSIGGSELSESSPHTPNSHSHQKSSSVASSTMSTGSWAAYAGLVADAEPLELTDSREGASGTDGQGVHPVSFPSEVQTESADSSATQRPHVHGEADAASHASRPAESLEGILSGGLGIHAESTALLASAPPRSQSTPTAPAPLPQGSRNSDPIAPRRSRQASFAGSTSTQSSRQGIALSRSSKSSSFGSVEDGDTISRAVANTAPSWSASSPRSPHSDGLGTPSSSAPSLTPKTGSVSGMSAGSPIVWSAGGARRKPKPSSLAIGPISSLSGSKGLASPIARGRTPPPTNPPDEPLPPLPVSASFMKSVRSPAAEDVARGFASPPAQPRELTHRSGSSLAGSVRNSLDSSKALATQPAPGASQALQYALGAQGAAVSSNSHPPRGGTTDDGTYAAAPDALDSKAAAAVASNHRETLAGAESAEAVLRSIQPRATFDEVHAHSTGTGAMPTHAEGDRDVAAEVEEEEEPDAEDDDDDPEASEVAIVRRGTLVSSLHQSASQHQLGNGSTRTSPKEVSLSRAGSVHRAEKVDLSSLSRTRDRSQIRRTGDLSLSSSPVVAATHSSGSAKGDTSNGAIPGVRTQARSPGLGTDAQKAEIAESKDLPVKSVAPDAKATSSPSSASMAVSHSVRRSKDMPTSAASKASHSQHKSSDSDARFAGAFGEIAVAFKQLQAEKRTLEKVIRATTPLEGLGNNGENFVRYLTTMNEKMEISAAEIRKLLELLERQRTTMDYMLEIHQAEVDSHLDEIDDLKDELEAAIETLETYKLRSASLARENEDLRSMALSGREEAAVARARVATESQGKAGAEEALVAVQAELQAAKLELFEASRLREQLQQELQTLPQHQTTLRAQSEGAVVSDLAAIHEAHAKEISTLGADHEREIWNLKEEHDNALLEHNAEIEKAAEALMQTHSEALDMLRGEHAETIEELQARIAALESSQEASRQAKHDLMEAVDDKDEQIARLTHELSVAEKERLELLSSDGEESSERGEKGHRKVSSGSISSGSQLSRTRESVEEGSSHLMPSTPTLTSGPGSAAPLEGTPSEQVAQLQSQLAEQRAREAQIRSAYKLLRDDHRRLQSSHKDFVERSGRGVTSAAASFNLGTPSSRPNVGEDDSGSGGLVSTPSHLSTPGTSGSYFHHNSASPTVHSNVGTPTSRALKRLSLPLASATGTLAAASKDSLPEHVVNALTLGTPSSLKVRAADGSSSTAAHPPNSWRGSFAGMIPHNWQPPSPSSRQSSTGSETQPAANHTPTPGSLGPSAIGYVGRGYIASGDSSSGATTPLGKGAALASLRARRASAGVLSPETAPVSATSNDEAGT